MIRTALTVSTAHMSYDDSVKVQVSKGNGVPLFSQYDEGMIMYKPSEKDEMVEEMSRAGYSSVMVNLFVYAFFELGVDLLIMDADGLELKGFPTFNW